MSVGNHIVICSMNHYQLHRRSYTRLVIARYRMSSFVRLKLCCCIPMYISLFINIAPTKNSKAVVPYFAIVMNFQEKFIVNWTRLREEKAKEFARFYNLKGKICEQIWSLSKDIDFCHIYLTIFQSYNLRCLDNFYVNFDVAIEIESSLVNISA